MGFALITEYHLHILRRIAKKPVWGIQALHKTHRGVTKGILRSLARRGLLAERRANDTVGYTITALGRSLIERKKPPKPLERVRRLPTEAELEKEGLA